MWSGRTAGPGAPRVRDTCHPESVNSSNTAKNCNDARHNVIPGVADENSNMCGVPTGVATRPYRAALKVGVGRGFDR
jgi:hypothetical protein